MQLKQGHLGFSLTELAVVMIIVALLVGGLVFPFGAQREVQRLRQAEASLADIREALLGFAAIHGYLPCPDMDTDPGAAGYGVAEISCSATPSREGFLPFKSLGLFETDPWGERWRYRVDRNFADSATPIGLTTAFGSDALSVENQDGTALTTTLERPVAIFYSLGPDRQANRGNASFEANGGRYEASPPAPEFDDLLQWLARPLLISRLIAAGRPL